jgi:hypothetical protein
MPHKDPAQAKECHRRKYERKRVLMANDPVFAEQEKQRQKVVKQRYYAKHKPRLSVTVKWDNIRRIYGLTREQYEAKLAEQDGRCGICKEVLSKPCIDHEHGTKTARGLLCERCNFGLGHFRDDPEMLRNAAIYLECEPWIERQ